MQNTVETSKDVLVAKPATDAAGRTSRYVSLKDYAGAEVTVYADQANAATIAITLLQATAVAGTSSKNGPNVPVYVNQDFAAGDTLTRQTSDSYTFTTSAAVKEKVVKFFVPAAALDTNNGFDCIAVSTGASNVANVTAATIRLVGPRYSQATPPTAATD